MGTLGGKGLKIYQSSLLKMTFNNTTAKTTIMPFCVENSFIYCHILRDSIY